MRHVVGESGNYTTTWTFFLNLPSQRSSQPLFEIKNNLSLSSCPLHFKRELKKNAFRYLVYPVLTVQKRLRVRLSTRSSHAGSLAQTFLALASVQWSDTIERVGYKHHPDQQTKEIITHRFCFFCVSFYGLSSKHKFLVFPQTFGSITQNKLSNEQIRPNTAGFGAIIELHISIIVDFSLIWYFLAMTHWPVVSSSDSLSEIWCDSFFLLK